MLTPDFVRGMMQYTDRFPGDHETRIVLLADFGNTGSFTPAILDTGSPWSILNPKLADTLGLDYQTTAITHSKLRIRGYLYDGWLSRLLIALVAEKGENAVIDSTVFIPKLDQDDDWLHPNFLGLTGFLERIRFAIDPEYNHFFFAALGDNDF